MRAATREDAARDRDRLRLAVREDTRVIRAAHPVLFDVIEAIRPPVVRIPRVGVLVQETELAREVLTDSARFTKQGPGASSDLWNPVLGDRVLMNMHGPEHRELRRKLQPIFAPKYVRALVGERIAPTWEAAADRLIAGESVDVARLTRETASEAIAVLVGIDREVVTDDIFRQVTELTGMVKLSKPTLGPKEVARAKQLIGGLTDAAAAAYRGDESTVPGRMRALGLSEEEALGAVGAFVLVGTETIGSAIPRTVALAIDSGWLPRIAPVEAKGDADAFVAESLRWTTPSLATLRSTVADTQLGPVQLRAGDRLVVVTYKANRQAGPFNPAAGRAASLKQLWFGAGEHFCIGAPLAMAEIDAALTAIRRAARVATLRVGRREPVRRTLIPTYRTLEVTR